MSAIWATAIDVTGAVIAWLDLHSGLVTALATIAIGVFTYSLVRVTNRQARITREAIELGNREYVSTHRPKLVVRTMIQHLDPGRPIRISYIVANIGDTAAHMKHVETTLWFRTASGQEFTPDLRDAELRTLIGGERCPYITTTAALQYAEAWGIHEGTGALEFRGFIVYADDNGVDRQTGFWRAYSAQTGRFHPKDGPDADYEYQD